MTCRDCGTPCDEDGGCIFKRHHRGRGTDIKVDTRDRVRRFLAGSDRVPDDEPMWMTNGIRINWGDLRVLADYEAGGEG